MHNTDYGNTPLGAHSNTTYVVPNSISLFHADITSKITDVLSVIKCDDAAELALFKYELMRDMSETSVFNKPKAIEILRKDTDFDAVWSNSSAAPASWCAGPSVLPAGSTIELTDVIKEDLLVIFNYLESLAPREHMFGYPPRNIHVQALSQLIEKVTIEHLVSNSCDTTLHPVIIVNSIRLTDMLFTHIVKEGNQALLSRLSVPFTKVGSLGGIPASTTIDELRLVMVPSAPMYTDFNMYGIPDTFTLLNDLYEYLLGTGEVDIDELSKTVLDIRRVCIDSCGTYGEVLEVLYKGLTGLFND